MIRIPDPCQEDFNKMTPTERGAFCSKCQINTFDFRHLSNDEINNIIRKNKGEHLCGRFHTYQLEDLNDGYIAWNNQSKRTFQSKFLFACVIVFGLGLFSCNQEKTQEQFIHQIQQKRLIEQFEENREHSQIKYINQEVSTQDIDLVDYVTIEQETRCTEFKEESYVETGGAVVSEDQLEMNQIENHNNYAVAGMIAISEDYEVFVDSVYADSSESTLADPIENKPGDFEAKAYPNPTRSTSNIVLDIKETGNFTIQLFDINGRIIQDIHHGQLLEGRQRFKIDLSNQESGMYIVNLISGDQKETLKIQKN